MYDNCRNRIKYTKSDLDLYSDDTKIFKRKKWGTVNNLWQLFSIRKAVLNGGNLDFLYWKIIDVDN